MNTLAIANNKGGTGKTTVAVNLAAGLARKGKRVLLADLDSQAQATTWLLGRELSPVCGTAEALTGHLYPSAILDIENHPRLCILPATPELTGMDIALGKKRDGQGQLGSSLSGVASRFDVAVLDCPPNLGLTVLSALNAADGALIPVVASYLALDGLGRFSETIERLSGLEMSARILGVLLFAADPREAITGETRDILRSELGAQLFKSEIRISTAAKALPATRKTVWDRSDPRGAEDYEALVTETLGRLRKVANP